MKWVKRRAPSEQRKSFQLRRKNTDCSTIWVARADDSFVCFGTKTRQRIFGPEILSYPEMVKGHEKRVGWTKELAAVDDGTRTRAVGNGTAEKRVGRELAWNHGQMRSTPETVAEKIGSSEEDQVKRCRHSSCFVEFSLVTHASVSPHMHVVLHTPPSALG